MTKISLYEMEIEGLTAEGWELLVEQENAYDEREDCDEPEFCQEGGADLSAGHYLICSQSEN